MSKEYAGVISCENASVIVQKVAANYSIAR
jgi:hypothetical protein